MDWRWLLCVFIAYLCGSIPMGVIAAQLSGGPDPRTVGSGRTGGTNALRALGRTGALDAARVRDAYPTGVPERLRVLRLRVPGYRLIEVAGHQRAYPPAA